MSLRSMKSLSFCMSTVINESINSLQSSVNTNTVVMARLSSLTYPNLLNLAQQATEVCDVLLPRHAILFAVSRKKDLFWHLTVKVYCRYKTLGDSVMARVYTIKEFLVLHGELLRSKELYESRNANLSCREQSETDVEDDVCCICFDRVPDVLLPCFHTFCRTCINRWNKRTYRLPGEIVDLSENRSQCPICRANFEDTSNAWELLELPSREDFLEQVPRHVRKLIVRFGQPVSKFPDDLLTSTESTV